MSNVVIRTDGGAKLGFGHIRRCLVLANEFCRMHNDVIFVLRHGDIESKNKILASGHDCYFLPEKIYFRDEIRELQEIGSKRPYFLLVDFSHAETLNETEFLDAYFRGMHEIFSCVTLIDGLMHECLSSSYDLDVDCVVIPYVGYENEKILAKYRACALGPKYFPIDKSYCDSGINAERQSGVINRVLVTAGGGDPTELSVYILEELQDIIQKCLDIHIIIGLSFSLETIQKIEKIVSCGRHKYQLIHAPSTLVEEFLWCDLAISASGLTKYELAATGTPAILISINQEHAEFNKPFSKLGTSWDLGNAGNIKQGAIANAVMDLLENQAERENMMEAGRCLIDGYGAQRIIEKMHQAAR